MLKRPLLRLPKQEEGAGRAPYFIALAVQFAMLAVLASVLSVPVINFFRHDATAHRNPVEDITYIQPPPQKTTAVRTTPPVSPKPVPAKVPPPEATVLVPPPSAPPVTPPPVEIPVGVTPPRGAPGDTAVDPRTVGRGGIIGLSPGIVDPRLLGREPPGFVADGPVRIARPSTDSAVRSWVRTYWDSVATAQSTRKNPNDWTFERNGDKYGLDQQWVYFGKFKLPTMLLALLPIAGQGNPNAFERNRQLESMRRDIMFQAMRAGSEEDFTTAVKALRARKDAEHQAEMAKKAAVATPPVKPPQ